MNEWILALMLVVAWVALIVLILMLPESIFEVTPTRREPMTKRKFNKLSVGDRIETTCGWKGTIVGTATDYVIVNLDGDAPGLTHNIYREVITQKI